MLSTYIQVKAERMCDFTFEIALRIIKNLLGVGVIGVLGPITRVSTTILSIGRERERESE